MEIKDLIIKTEKVNWQELKDLQPNNLKNPYHNEKLKKSLVKNGFSMSIFVWENPKTKEILICDGHTRRDVLVELKSEGYEVPDQLSCTFLDLPNRKAAIRYLLEVFNTKKNPIDETAMIDWFQVEGIEIKEVEVASLDIEAGSKVEELEAQEDDFEAGEVDQIKTDIVKGDIFEFRKGDKTLHRLMCGDSTSVDDVEMLMNGEKAELAHNDPPYGMKKEKDGVLNDNLNFTDLLQFNKDWISLQFAYLKDNGSWYCWGIDEPLMDIYSEILKPYIAEQKATFRNLITWDKGNGQGQMSEGFRMYPIADEKCLFVMRGVQGFNNNADNYFDNWEPVREYLETEIKKLGESDPVIAKALGYKDGRTINHWWSKSQWTFPTKENYEALREYSKSKNIDGFKKEYDGFKKEYDELKREYYSTRAYFDNTHDNQNNVWHFARTGNQEREGTGEHATPKPIELCQRAIKSSCPENGLVIDFFLGSGSTMVASHQLKRRTFGMELDPKYCQVICDRMKKLDPEFEIIKI